jgi:hypothetical protein
MAWKLLACDLLKLLQVAVLGNTDVRGTFRIRRLLPAAAKLPLPAVMVVDMSVGRGYFEVSSFLCQNLPVRALVAVVRNIPLAQSALHD